MKKLITEKNVSEIIAQGQKTICANEDTMFTPSAKDILKANGIEICYGEPPAVTLSSFATPGGHSSYTASPKEPEAAPAEAAPAPAFDGLSSDVIYNALKKLADAGMLDQFVNSINAAAPGGAPYIAECDTGFKIARGAGVQMEVFDTGVPGDLGKATYQELIGADDGSSMNAGFFTVDHCSFDWDVEPQEIYYIIEGSMTVTVEGRPHTANAGDCFFIQKGSKVVFSSGNTCCRVFYCTY